MVTGANYPPTQTQVMIAQVSQVLWFAGLAFTFAGDQLIKAVGIKEPPAMVRQVQDNKMFVLGSLWFLNNYGNSQLSTGAFEIMLDDEVIFSKLESKRVPTAEEVLNILKEAGFN